MHIAEVYNALQSLRGHSYNIYEVAFLDAEKLSLKLAAVCTFVMQLVILTIIVALTAPKTNQINNKIEVIAIVVSTTSFFVRSAYNEYTSASEFNEAFACVGSYSPMLFLNTCVNKYLSVLVPLYNIYFMLLSEDAVDAIMNSLALYFILELDQMATPPMDDAKIADELAINFHDYIMQPLNDDQLSVTLLVKKGGGSAKNDDQEPPSPVFTDDDKLYVSVPPAHRSTGQRTIVVYKRIGPTHYHSFVYEIHGSNAGRLVNEILQFRCIAAYRDIHD